MHTDRPAYVPADVPDEFVDTWLDTAEGTLARIEYDAKRLGAVDIEASVDQARADLRARRNRALGLDIPTPTLADYHVQTSVLAPRDTAIIDDHSGTITLHPLDAITMVHRPAPDHLIHAIGWILHHAHRRFDACIAALAASPQPTNGHTS